MKILLVGDTHAVPDELDDCSRLIEFIIDVCRTNDVREVLFLGDQHHTHAILRLEVMNFWRTAFTALRSAGLRVACLVGNHDQASPGSSINAMAAYQGLVEVIDRPKTVKGIMFLPYYHDQAEFLEACRGQDGGLFKPKTVICHQTFDGSTYENGFLASDGFDPNLVPQELIISGHIHTAQEFGKVWYLGAPRWRTLSDANTERALWVVEFNEGRLVKRTPFDTGVVCKQIKHVIDTEEKPVSIPLDPRHQWRVDVKGSESWCNVRKIALTAPGVRVRVFPDQASRLGQVRESEGIEKAFRSFMGCFEPIHGTDRALLDTMVKERLKV